MVRRLGLRRDAGGLEEILRDLRATRREVLGRNSVESLRGTEGAASLLVFKAIAAVVDPCLGFTHRAIRSGRDPFNVVLDVLGGLLASTATGAVAAARLDPYEGAMHGDSRGAPALALDLEDVYRPLLVSATALTLFSKKMLAPDDFALLPGGSCRLTPAGLATVCRAFGRASRREVRRGGQRRPATYLRHVILDARSLATWFKLPERPYEPLTVK